MARQRVYTACRDCKGCTNSALAGGGRKLGKGLIAVGTAGMSLAVMAARKQCDACGHQLSLHSGIVQQGPAAQAAAPNVTVHVAAPPTAAPQPSGPPPGFYADPQGSGQKRWWDGATWTEHYTD